MISISLSLIPFVMLILFNLLIYRVIKSKSALFPRSSMREKRDLRVATILLVIIMVYVACHGIITFINVVEIWAIIIGKTDQLLCLNKLVIAAGSDHTKMWSHNMNIMVSISHVLITVSCSSNFAIYCFMVSI